MTPTNPPQYSISEILEKGMIDCYKAGLDHGITTSEYGVGIILEQRELPVLLAVNEAEQAINQLIYTQVLELIDNVDPTGASITAKRIRDKAKAKYI